MDDVIAAYPERTYLAERHQRLVENPKKLRKRLVETHAAIARAIENPQANEIVRTYLADIERLAEERCSSS